MEQHKLSYNQVIKNNLILKNGRCSINSLYVADVLQIEHTCIVNQIKTILKYFPVFMGSLFIDETGNEETFYLNTDSFSFLNLGVQFNFDNIFPLFSLVNSVREVDEQLILEETI